MTTRPRRPAAARDASPERERPRLRRRVDSWLRAFKAAAPHRVDLVTFQESVVPDALSGAGIDRCVAAFGASARGCGLRSANHLRHGIPWTVWWSSHSSSARPSVKEAGTDRIKWPEVDTPGRRPCKFEFGRDAEGTLTLGSPATGAGYHPTRPTRARPRGWHL